MINIIFLILGVWFGWQWNNLISEIIQNTDDLNVMRCKNPKYIEKYNKEQDKIEKSIEEQLKIIRIIKLEKKL